MARNDGGPVATKGYAICGEPRSGSNFLCQVLASTGVLGQPLDYLNAAGRRAKGEPDYPYDPDAQIDIILRRGSGPNGVYGFKMFSVRFDDVAGCGWTRRLPGLRFIHLTRDDILGQAISDWKAAQTGQYRSTAPAGGAPRYDRREIEARMAGIARGESRWRRWFARNGINPLRLRYEDLAADPQQAAEQVARHLKIEERPRVHLARVELARQRDALSEEWRTRFLAEAGDMSYLDQDAWPRFVSSLRRFRRRVTGKPL